MLLLEEVAVDEPVLDAVSVAVLLADEVAVLDTDMVAVLDIDVVAVDVPVVVLVLVSVVVGVVVPELVAVWVSVVDRVDSAVLDTEDDTVLDNDVVAVDVKVVISPHRLFGAPYFMTIFEDPFAMEIAEPRSMRIAPNADNAGVEALVPTRTTCGLVAFPAGSTAPPQGVPLVHAW